MKILVVLILLLASSFSAFAQSVAFKANLMYGGYTQTPNLGVEASLSKRSTLELSGGYNPWNRLGTDENNKKAVHWLGSIEYRYWTCRKFAGSFFGMHVLGSHFNIAGYELPLLFEKGSKDYRYNGYTAGIGLSYGHVFALSDHWNFELTMGAGYAKLCYDRYTCELCDEKKQVNRFKNYFGPTKAGISLIYTF